MPTKVAYLGPEGTYAEKAAISLTQLERLDDACLVPSKGLGTVIEQVASGQCDLGVVPIENSVEGGVTATLDALWKHQEIFIQRALILPINHCLFSSGEIKDISEVLSHPQALAQCSEWLNKNLPDALQLPTSSTAAAVRMIKGSKFRAAIASINFRDVDNIKEIAYPINDIAGNRTRFILISNNESTLSGDIASIAFSLKSNSPGALLKALSCIAELGLNMRRIESRPSKRELGEYVFFVDIEINNEDNSLTNKIMANLNPLCEHLVHFGSYKTDEYN
tara:strand:- start:1956 stop:2792 length:837 start_codon:yes stop_codon:yes gene_type:complete